MKRFFLSAGAVLLVLGLGLSWAGTRMGGETKATVHLFGRSWDVYAPTTGWGVVTSTAGSATPTFMPEVEERPEMVTDHTATPFTSVNVDVDLGNVTIAAGDDYGVEIETWGSDYTIDHWYSDDTLYLESNSSDLFTHTTCGSEITVYVPMGTWLEMVYVDLDLGDVTLAGLQLEHGDLSLDLGSLTGEALMVRSELAVEASLGEVVLFGDLGEYVDISADLGSVQLGLSRPATEYSWELEADMGSVTVDGQEQSLVDHELTGGTGNRTIEVDASLGSITLDFDQGFAGEQTTTVTTEGVTEGKAELSAVVQEGTSTATTE